MSLHAAIRARAGELVDLARDEATENVARLFGRGAGWVEETGRLLGDRAVSMTANLANTAGTRATRGADRLAGTVDRWSAGLSDRLVRLGVELSDSRHERD